MYIFICFCIQNANVACSPGKVDKQVVHIITLGHCIMFLLGIKSALRPLVFFFFSSSSCLHTQYFFSLSLLTAHSLFFSPVSSLTKNSAGVSFFPYFAWIPYRSLGWCIFLSLWLILSIFLLLLLLPYYLLHIAYILYIHSKSLSSYYETVLCWWFHFFLDMLHCFILQKGRNKR